MIKKCAYFPLKTRQYREKSKETVVNTTLLWMMYLKNKERKLRITIASVKKSKSPHPPPPKKKKKKRV